MPDTGPTKDDKTQNDENWAESEVSYDPPEHTIIKGEVSPNDLFHLGKVILLFCVSIFIIVMGLYIFKEPLCIAEPMKEVWAFSKQVIVGFVSLIIGFYFGGSIKK